MLQGAQLRWKLSLLRPGRLSRWSSPPQQWLGPTVGREKKKSIQDQEGTHSITSEEWITSRMCLRAQKCPPPPNSQLALRRGSMGSMCKYSTCVVWFPGCLGGMTPPGPARQRKPFKIWMFLKLQLDKTGPHSKWRRAKITAEGMKPSLILLCFNCAATILSNYSMAITAETAWNVFKHRDR